MASKSLRKADGFDLSQTASHLLRLCWQHANDLFSQEPGAGDLTKPQFTVLSAVEQHDGISQTQLVALTKIDRSTLAEMLHRMLEKELVVRERTAEDARANALHIASSGKKALRTARAANERVEKGLLASLSAPDRARFIKLLAAVAGAAEAAEAKGRRVRRKGRPGAGR